MRGYGKLVQLGHKAALRLKEGDKHAIGVYGANLPGHKAALRLKEGDGFTYLMIRELVGAKAALRLKEGDTLCHEVRPCRLQSTRLLSASKRETYGTGGAGRLLLAGRKGCSPP